MKTQVRIKRLIALAYLFLMPTAVIYSQDTTAFKRTIGIGASIQSSEFGITIPIWITKNFVLAPAIGLSYAETVSTDVAFGLMPKYYFKTDKFAPFIDIKFAAIMNYPSKDNTIDDEKELDYLGGIGFGAEYFFSPHFSFGVEAQANMTISDKDSDRYGNPDGVNMNLATAVIANIYFGR